MSAWSMYRLGEGTRTRSLTLNDTLPSLLGICVIVLVVFAYMIKRAIVVKQPVEEALMADR